MPLKMLSCDGGHLVLPDRASLLVGAANGGNLVVLPPRPVWERSELSARELERWAYLIAAAGRAMLDVLPQLAGGCINYWEAGNWALNDAAEPVGRKRARDHRSVHLHLLGRSPAATDAAWQWGESPRFPAYAERHTWAASFDRLGAAECRAIVTAAAALLRERYGLTDAEIAPVTTCIECAYPFVAASGQAELRCDECRTHA
jgi:hypothetical protein